MRMWITRSLATGIFAVSTVAATAGGIPALGDQAAATLSIEPSIEQALLTVGRHPLQKPWKVYETDHFVIAYGSDPWRAARQGNLLEATHEQFYATFGQGPFDLQPLREPMICLFFEDKANYLQYARRVDGVDMAWTVAYYSARTNRIAFFRSGAFQAWDQKPVQDDATPAQLLLYGNPSARTGPLTAQVRVSLASATHEAAHQLAFNTGLQRRGVTYPLWVSEGLATSFEMVRPGEPFGPGHDNPTRRRRLQRLGRHDRLLPLARLIVITHPRTDDARATDALYAQSWGLFQFLYRRYPQGLSDYLDSLRGQSGGVADAADLRRQFVTALGPIEQIEPQWRRWVAQLHS